MEYIIARLSEPSTWRGIVWLITAFGVAIDPAQQEGIIAFGMALRSEEHTSELQSH